MRAMATRDRAATPERASRRTPRHSRASRTRCASRARMPAYATSVMSDQDIADIYAYLLAIPKSKRVDEISILAGARPAETK